MFNFHLGNIHYWNVSRKELHDLFAKEVEKQYAEANK